MNQKNNSLELLISEDAIQSKIRQIADRLNAEYQNTELTIVMILKGAFCLVADLMRHLDIPFTIEVVQGSSYGQRGVKKGELITFGVDKFSVSAKDVMVIDDIFDSGHTLGEIVKELKKQGPRSIKTLVLLSKKVPRESAFEPDYALFDVPDAFVVGYGLDYKEHYRGLRDIYVLKRIP